MDFQARQKQQRHWAVILTVSTLILQYSTFLTTMMQRPEKAFWNKEETTALVDYLHTHRAEAGDGGNFKTVTFQAASVHLTSPLT
jgi:erythromycin esterase-like protein